MSYIVLARKWRPQNFDDVTGQEHITTTLKNAILSGRIGHAFLFTGPRGVGKTSCARILAKSLNCQDGSTVTPCQVCSSCREITEGRSLDVMEIDGASNTGVDNIRDLRENVKFAPSSGRFKIYIIDEVHMLSDAAFNALLKTLEEPPPHVKFIFATTLPHKVLSTVISRCQRFDFRRIPILKIIEKLERIIKEEGLKINKDVLFAIARASEGSMRDAESILDQLTSFTKDKISLAETVSLLGIVDQQSLSEITDRIIERDAIGALRFLDLLISQGKDISQLLVNLIEHFRNLMIAKVTKFDQDKLLDLPENISKDIIRQSQYFSLEEIFSIFNLLLNTQEMSKKIESLRIPLEIALLKLTKAKAQDNEVNTTQPQTPKENIQNSDTPKVADDKANGSLVPPVDLDIIKKSWRDVIQHMSKIKMSVATYLQEGQPTKLENNILTITFPKNSSFHKEALERKGNHLIIENAFKESISSNLKIVFALSNENKPELPPEQDEPSVKSALDTFKGRLINS